MNLGPEKEKIKNHDVVGELVDPSGFQPEVAEKLIASSSLVGIAMGD